MLGVLDSGIGGLGIMRKIVERWPDSNIIYFADTGRAPYGNKSAATVMRYALRNMELLQQLGAGAVLILSHTVACVAGDRVRDCSNVPVLDVAWPTARMALQTAAVSCVGIAGSRTTVDSGRYGQMIRSLNPAVKVFAAACPLLVPLVEEGWLQKPETVRIIKKYLHPLKVRQIDTLILGCNHYTLLKKVIQRKIGRKVRLMDAGDAIIGALTDFFTENDALARAICSGGRQRYLVSDLNPQLLRSARRIFGANITLEYQTVRDPVAGH